MALGSLLTILASWQADIYWQCRVRRALYAPVGGHHRQPSTERIAALGCRGVPDVCTAIEGAWRPGQGASGGSIPWWTIALGKMGDRRAVPLLIALTDHDDSFVRYHAVLAMSQIGDQRCLPALRRLKQDPNERVAEMAANVAWQFGVRPTAGGSDPGGTRQGRAPDDPG